jgi:hypothetical protein
VAGSGENYGTEQEHLNNVAGAHLRITSLRVSTGPAIELLDYLAPIDGRPYPHDARANDLAHWQTRLVSTATSDAAGLLRSQGAQFISPGLVPLPDSALGFQHGALLRDPDGHAMQIVGQ